MLVQYANPEQLGIYFIALSFSVLLSIFVNFGTSQTALISLKKADTEEERMIIAAETLGVRLFPLMLSAIICILAPFFIENYGFFFLLSLPMIFAEFLNPQVYLIATYRIKTYMLLNFALKSFLLATIYLFRTDPQIIAGTLLSTGLINVLLNIVFLPSTFLKKDTLSHFPNTQKIRALTSENALIMGNGITGQLQQSLFLFALPGFASPIFVSAYGFIDKLISSFRMLINAYGNAFMPRAAGLHKEGFEQWKKNKQQQNVVLTIGCVIIAMIMFVFPEQLLHILLLGKQKDAPFFIQTATLIKAISMVPLLMAINLLNVAETFLEKKYTLHFKGGLILLLITILSIALLNYSLPYYMAGYYPMIIEGTSLIISLFIVQQIRNAQQ